MTVLDHGILTGRPAAVLDRPAPWVVVPAQDPAELAAYRRLRQEVFVEEQGLFGSHDADDVDDDPRTVVLVARSTGSGSGPSGAVLGGVRVHPAPHPATAARDLGWWRGSRLAVAPAARRMLGVGQALVRSACAVAESAGALRFDAVIQAGNAVLFRRLGWTIGEPVLLHGRPHLAVDWPVGRVARLVERTKAPLGELVAGLLGGRGGAHALGGAGFVGDDGAPVPGSDLVAACDAILPAMVERDPEWAGWCAVLVNVNDLTAMGARPVALLDAVAARDASFARRILRGLADAAHAWDVPVLGGHTQFGVPAALSVTALGRAPSPVPGGGGRPGHGLRLTADLSGDWRPGYGRTQWDSTSRRTREELRSLTDLVRVLRPSAAKDVSMAGLVGTAGMLAEASGCRAVLDVAAVPRPETATVGDWFTCFPGYAMLTTVTAGQREGDAAQGSGTGAPPGLPDGVASAVCGELVDGGGVGLRWPDGVVTEAVAAGVTGLGAA